jgi:hypothetical protein
VWLGMPTSSRQSEIDSQKAFEEGGGARHQLVRRTMWIDYLMPKKKKSKLRSRGQRRPFDLDRSGR